MSGRWPVLSEHLEKIPYFVAIAQAGSLQQAAREVRVAQPSLTKAMHGLEAALKVTLFHRSRQGVKLTAAGEELRRFAEPLLASLAALERRLREVDGETASGEIRVGTHELLVREFWPELVRDLRRSTPHLTLTLFTTPSVGELLRRLIAGELDVVVAVECPPKPGLVRRLIRTDSYGLYASPSYCRDARLKAKAKISVAQLLEHPMIYAADVIAGPGILLGAALKAAGIDRPSLYAVRSIESVASLVESGLGIGLLPRRMVAADPQSRLLELQAPTLAGGHLGRHGLYLATTELNGREASLADIQARIVGLLPGSSK